MPSHTKPRLPFAAQLVALTFVLIVAMQIASASSTQPIKSPPVVAASHLPIRSASSSAAVSPQDAVPYAGIAVLSSAGDDAVTQNQAIHEAGHVNALDSTTITQTFILVNNSQTPLLIDHIATSCRCTTALVGNIGEFTVADDTKPSDAIPGLGPNERLPVKVTTNLVGQPDGPLLKRVLIYAHGQNLPAAELVMMGQVGPTFSFDSSVLDFGSVDAGQPHAQQLAVRINSRIIGPSGLPTLKSSSPDIKVELGTISSTVAPKGFTSVVSIKYNVIVLPTAKDGALDGRIAFAPAKNDSAKELAWQSSFVEVTGTVVGTVSAAPAALTFNNVAAGHKATRSVMLLSKNAADFDGATVTSNHPWLTGHVEASGANPKSAAQGILVVTVADSLPPGFLDGVVTITLARTGERLAVPVDVVVIPK